MQFPEPNLFDEQPAPQPPRRHELAIEILKVLTPALALVSSLIALSGKYPSLSKPWVFDLILGCRCSHPYMVRQAAYHGVVRTERPTKTRTAAASRGCSHSTARPQHRGTRRIPRGVCRVPAQRTAVGQGNRELPSVPRYEG